MERMKVFISWSGDVSRAVAKVWVELIEETFDAVEAFISDDIEAGFRGLDEIKEALDGTSFAIVVVTRANEKAPWLNFEAGAISKQFPGDPIARVVPCLVDFTSPAQLTTPLKQFQAKLLNEQGVEDILSSIATRAEVSWSKKRRAYESAWTNYYSGKFEEASTSATDVSEEPNAQHEPLDRSNESMFEEILEILRESKRSSISSTVRRMPGKLLMKHIVDDITQFIDSTDAGKCTISVGLNYDAEDPTGFIVFMDINGLNAEHQHAMLRGIIRRSQVNHLFVNTDGMYLEQIAAAQWRHGFTNLGGES